MEASPAAFNGDTARDGELRHRHHIHEHFANFFECWIAEQDRDLRSLRSAAAALQQDDETSLSALVDRVVGHYEDYYQAKAASSCRDVLPMFNPSWTSSTENLFLWIGGWRPTTAIHLLYSKSSLQMESSLEEIIRGELTRDLTYLTPEQIERIDRLHRWTVRLEREISEEEASAQEAVADGQMVELSHELSENRSNGDDSGRVEVMESAMRTRMQGMEEVLRKADQLRLETLKGVVEILKPMQAVQYLIAAAELHLRVHEFGKNKDAAAAGSDGVPDSGHSGQGPEIGHD